MPLLPPVTTIVLPERSGMSLAVHAFLSGIAGIPPRRPDESYHTIAVSHEHWVQGSPLPPTAQVTMFVASHRRGDAVEFLDTGPFKRSELQCKWEWSAWAE